MRSTTRADGGDCGDRVNSGVSGMSGMSGDRGGYIDQSQRADRFDGPALALIRPTRRNVVRLLALVSFGSYAGRAASSTESSEGSIHMTSSNTSSPLGPRQLAIGPIAAATAVGDMPRLTHALSVGLDAGLPFGDVREVLVQLYAYAGFPRSLNALGALMKVLDERRARGVTDAPGRESGPVPPPERMLESGTANQTKLSGAPVKGALFDFAPAIDQYLKAHLFGDIFARDNVDWQMRELATVAALSALIGVESQLGSHVRIAMNVGITHAQLREFAADLSSRGVPGAGQRLAAALDQPAG